MYVHTRESSWNPNSIWNQIGRKINTPPSSNLLPLSRHCAFLRASKNLGARFRIITSFLFFLNSVSRTLLNSGVGLLFLLGAFAKIAARDYYVRHVCMFVCPSVHTELTPTGRIYMKCNTSEFFENLSRKLKFHRSLTKIAGILHEYE